MRDWLYDHPAVSKPLAFGLLALALVLFVIAEFVGDSASIWIVGSIAAFVAGVGLIDY